MKKFLMIFNQIKIESRNNNKKKFNKMSKNIRQRFKKYNKKIKN